MSRLTQHTPGPWRECKSTPSFVESLNGHILAQTVELYDGTSDRERTAIIWANARLIAAAPDLLEALEMVSKFNWRNNRTHLLGIVNSAIANAKGEQI